MTPFWEVSDLAEYCNDHFKMVEDTDDSFRMWQGLVGPCYTPVLSNDGTLSWTNNANLPNPEAVNIRGPQGAGIRIAGIVDSEESLPASASDGAIWLVGEGSPYEGYAWISSGWIDLGPLTVGPAGPPGPQGDDYELTEADKQEIAEISESILLTELDNEPLGVRYGGTGARTVEGAKQMLGIDEITDKLGTWPLGTDAQDVAGAINEMIGEIDLQVADIEQLKNDFAGEFSPTSTYTVGTYVVYDGAFWRCTTAVTTAGSWTGNSNWTQVTAGGELQTANTNISTLASDISDLNTALSGKVSKAGDTMTGDLILQDGSCITQDTRITSGTAPSSDIYGKSVYLNDSARFNVGTWQIMSLTNGREGFQLVAGKKVNNVNKFNYIRMLVDANGNPVVELNGSAAWRSALGVESYTIDNRMATFTENITGTNTRLILKNKSITVYYQGEVKTHATNDVLFTLNSGYRPSFQFYVPCTFNQAGFGVIEVNTNGVVRITQISSGGSASARVYAHFTFPIA